ncbi:GyrI-like domain-containing protein [Kribbella sp. NBC_00382]|uniref:GyrI-like domain-containing protein n=1 Tax=Kribbella sp. NBC_00382 TaxID=2975967 RepID=UPI002E1FBBF7
MRTAVVEARTFAAQSTVVRRTVLQPAQVHRWVSATLGELAELLRRRRVVPSGFPFSRQYPMPSGQVIVEAGFPLAIPVMRNSTSQPSLLPAGPVAVTAYDGPYDEIGTAYDLVDDWLRRHDAKAAGAAWEVYHSPPLGSPDGWHPEIVQPYADACDSGA